MGWGTCASDGGTLIKMNTFMREGTYKYENPSERGTLIKMNTLMREGHLLG